MRQIERVTTEYVAEEDRIRLVATLRDGETLAAWLTQRLLQRLVAALVQWLQAQGADVPTRDALRAEVMQGFAQQVARARMTPQPPVRAVPGEVPWLVCSVDMARHPQAVRLTFKGVRGADRAVSELGVLTLAPQPLRQWLNILFDNYRRAEWPLQAWPDWVAESAQPLHEGAVVMH